MMTKTRFAPGICLLAVLLTSCATSTVSSPTTAPTMTPAPASPPFIILAYATDGIFADIIPYEQLTHINYSFLTPKADGTFNTLNNAWKLKQIVKTAHEHDVRVSISVGGWGWDKEFETLTGNPESRSAFVQNLKTFVNEYQLDGTDIDWEYPDPGQSSQNFLALIRELRVAMPDKLLTTAVIAYGDDTGLGIPSESFELFDFVNVMTYEGSGHGTMEQFNDGLTYWSGRGLPKEKLVIGVPFYSDGGVSFAKLVKGNPAAAQTDTTEYIGVQQFYNGIPTIQTKTQIAMEKAGGIMFWVLDHDAQGEYSLVNAIYQTVHTP
jgi:GH18 family chitinase